ncbi:MAG: MFS transporter [Candidatus Fimenecus sp.]
MSKTELFCEKNGKLNVKNTILTGFGFLATSIAWAIYDPYITKILNHLLGDSAWVTNLSAKLNESIPFLARLAAAQGDDVNLAGGGITLVPLFIGIIMTFDNIFGVIFQPTFGKLSDRCHSKLGKRRPFIVFGAPVCAVLFALIPLFALKGSLPLTMTFIILFVFVMSLWRAPVVALMPDLTPPELRSEGNAIINLMGGLGGLIGMVAGTAVTLIYTAITGVSINSSNEERIFPYVFLTGSVVMLIGMLVVLFKVKEPDSRLKAVAEQNIAMDEKARAAAEKQARKEEKAQRKAQKLSKGERKSLVFMLMGLFFLFCGTNAITTFFALFAAEILHFATSQATILMAIFAVCSAAAAIPAGKMGKKLGRKKTILAGLSIFIVAFVVFFAIFNVMIAKDGFSMNSFNATNKAYIAVTDEINDYNDANNLKGDDVLKIDGYISYLNGENSAQTEKYKAFDDSLTEKGFSFDSIVKIANEQFGLSLTTADRGQALSAVSTALNKVIAIMKVLIFPVLVLGGAANMFITVNTLPLVLEIGGIEKVGTFTGYYYTATFSAQIASPIVYGVVAMLSGTYLSLFYYSPIAFVLSVLCIFVVKHGEAIPQEVIDKIEEENAD